jgi:hypothetical protein
MQYFHFQSIPFLSSLAATCLPESLSVKHISEVENQYDAGAYCEGQGMKLSEAS